MLNYFAIGNFQSFGLTKTDEGVELQGMKLSRVNLFYGQNASGKSSILRALKFLSHNLKGMKTPTLDTWQFTGNGFGLGNFQSSVHNHDLSQPMIFRMAKKVRVNDGPNDAYEAYKRTTGFTLAQLRAVGLDVEGSDSGLDDFAGTYGDDWFDMTIHLTVGISNPGQISFLIFEVDPYVRPGSEKKIEKPIQLTFRSEYDGFQPALDGTALRNAWTFSGLESKENSADLIQVCELVDLLWQHEETDRITSPLNLSQLCDLEPYDISSAGNNLQVTYLADYLGFEKSPHPISQAIAAHLNGLLNFIWSELRYSISEVTQVPPLREVPELIQRYDGPLFVNYLSALMQAQAVSEPVDENVGKPENAFMFDNFEGVKLARQWFRRLCEEKFDFELTPIDLPGAGQVACVLNVVSGESRVSFSNVGVGLSQIFPVLLTLFASPSRYAGISMIEQPELHLHPKMQSDMADAIIASANRYQYHQVFIESHSENLVLRFMRRLRETSMGNLENELRPEDIEILYVQKKSKQAKLDNFTILDTGEIVEEWPLDFVEIRMDDVL